MAGESKGVELLEVATITNGKRPPIVVDARSSVYSVPVVGGSGVMGFTNAALFNEPILVTGRVGTLGQLYCLKEPSWPSDNRLVVIPADASQVDDEPFEEKMKRLVAQLREQQAEAQCLEEAMSTTSHPRITTLTKRVGHATNLR